MDWVAGGRGATAAGCRVRDGAGVERQQLRGPLLDRLEATPAPQCDALATVFGQTTRDVNLVLGPRAPGTSIPFAVLVDGEPPGEARGLDVDEEGNGTVVHQRLYQLIREPGSITDSTLR